MAVQKFLYLGFTSVARGYNRDCISTGKGCGKHLFKLFDIFSEGGREVLMWLIMENNFMVCDIYLVPFIVSKILIFRKLPGKASRRHHKLNSFDPPYTRTTRPP